MIFLVLLISSLPHHKHGIIFHAGSLRHCTMLSPAPPWTFQWFIWLYAWFDIDKSVQKKAKFGIWICQVLLYLVHYLICRFCHRSIEFGIKGKIRWGCPQIIGLIIGEYTVISFGRDDPTSFSKMILSFNKKNINQPSVRYWAKAKTNRIDS